MPTELKMDMHSSWFKVGLRLYERMVFTPRFCGSDVSYTPCRFDLRYAYLHQCGIAKTAGSVGERIADAEISALAAFLVVDTKDHEALVGNRVDKVLALYDDRVGSSDSRRERAESGEVACELDGGQL
jgi:hypothetical protein